MARSWDMAVGREVSNVKNYPLEKKLGQPKKRCLASNNSLK